MYKRKARKYTEHSTAVVSSLWAAWIIPLGLQTYIQQTRGIVGLGGGGQCCCRPRQQSARSSKMDSSNDKNIEFLRSTNFKGVRRIAKSVY
jgi:hypothetical protein